jgi:hypothetical protein
VTAANLMRFPLPRTEVSTNYLRVPLIVASIALTLLPNMSFCQQNGTDSPGASQSEPEKKRIFGIIPNYRTSPTLRGYKPLTPKGKFKIAAEDSFDRGTAVLAAAFAGQAQLTNSNPSFGQGIKGYARNLGTAYGDFVIGNFMTEALYPTILHQDPRYFRRGTGSGWSRLGYAVGQVVWTHKDSGGTQFNFSEIAGNSTAVAISNAYYQDNRTASNAVSKLGIQIGVDSAANVLKEFWPDFQRRFSRKQHSRQP